MRFSSCVALCATAIAVHAHANEIITANADIYINAKSSTNYYMWCTNASVIGYNIARNWSFVWTLVPTGDDETYYIYNKIHSQYLGKTSQSTGSDIATVDDETSAGRYRISLVENDLYTFEDVDNTTDYRYIVFAGSGNLKNGTLSNSNSSIRVISSDTETSLLVKSILSYCDIRIGNYIGSIANTPEISRLVAELKETGDYQIASQLAQEIGTSINMPKEGHYYQIKSAFPYYSDKIIAETYYTQDYYEGHDAQRLYYMNMEPNTETIMVPTFWKFEKASNNKYRIKGANTGKYWSHSYGNVLISGVGNSSTDLGLYTIRNHFYDKVVYDNAVVLYSTNRWESGSRSGFISIFEDTHEGVHDFDVRHCENSVKPTDGKIDITPDKAPNNWYITEVTDFDLYFPIKETIANNDGYGNVIESYNTESKSYRSVYFPFAIKLPQDVTAYALLDENSVVEGAFEIAVVDLPDKTTGILPAYSAAILEAPQGTTQTFEILYDDENEPINFDLIGTLEPHPVESGEMIYAVEDPQGFTSHLLLRIGDRDYSYDATNLYKSTGKAYYSLINSDATYIVGHNRGYVKSKTAKKDGDNWIYDAYNVKAMELGGRQTTGVEDISIDVSENKSVEDLRYYDIHGRQVVNPQHGLYIRSDGKKIYVK